MNEDYFFRSSRSLDLRPATLLSDLLHESSRVALSLESRIPTRIQRSFWQFLSLLLKGIVIACVALIAVLRVVFIPVRFLARIVFVLLLVNLYKLYLILKMRLVSIWRPAKNRLLFPLSTRYVVHAVLIILTIFVTTNSLKAKEVRQQDSFRPSLLAGLLRDNSANDEIVETSDAILTHADYYSGIGGVSPLDMVAASADTPQVVAATQDNSSLMKPNLATTTVGERPRVGVLYHEVTGGETIGSIAEQYGISINTILWENQLGARDYIQPGQKLTILPVTGVSHRVQSGDTVATIAAKYKADESEIIAYNKLANGSAINVDQVLIIPHGSVPPPVVPVTSTPVRLATTTTGSTNYSSNPPPGIRAPQGGGLLWPTVSHKINQYFTYRHTGIDIDGEYSSPVYAADSGTVTFAGWDGSGYGLHIMINHGNGMVTLYGHSSKIFVKTGQHVSKGQTIMMQGCTGWCTGVHLHFEVRINGRIMNPFSYL